MNRFEKRSTFPVSQQELFAWHERPDAFELLTPPSRKVTIANRAEGPLRKGYWQVMRIQTPIGAQDWKALITEFDPPHFFVDEQESGPFAYWRHRHEMVALDGHTSELRDQVDYKLPLGWLGQLLGGAYVRRDLQKLFDYRHQQMTTLLSA